MISNMYGAGSGTIWLDDVNCHGDESALEDCSHSGWETHDCVHDEDVSITCSTDVTNAVGKLKER